MSVIDRTEAASPVTTSLFIKILKFRELAIVVAILLVFALTYFKNSSFASTASIQQMLSGPAIIILSLIHI